LSDFASYKNHADKTCFAFPQVDCLLVEKLGFIPFAESDKSPDLCQKRGLGLRNRTKVPICAIYRHLNVCYTFKQSHISQALQWYKVNKRPYNDNCLTNSFISHDSSLVKLLDPALP